MPIDLVPWILLFGVVGGMLAVDLLVINREARRIPFREAALWSVVWISTAMAFGVYVTLTRGGQAGAEYLAGYLIELSLSVDNVFVFALIFTAFAVPPAYQHRLLFWGILGAVVFRGVFIGAGTAVLAAAHWVIYLLGILLVVTGIRLARSGGHEVDPERNPVLRLFRRVVPTTVGYRGASFIVHENGRRLATPLLAALVVVETSDIMFAIDSIPAIFAITIDPFIIFSSNLFAILGLRSLYFLLAGLLDRFVYLKLGLATLLVFAGIKILIGDIYHIPIAVALGVIVIVLGTSVIASLIATRPGRSEPGVARPGVGRTARGRWSAVRVASSVLLGTAALVMLGVVAAGRDGDGMPLAVEVTLVAIATAILVAGLGALRYVRAGATVIRGWATAGALGLVVLGVIVALD